MGLFSSKKTITVSSTLYNMAGDENDRPDFIKGALFGSVMANSDSLADDIQTSLFRGPGMKQRQFFRYADRNNIPGMVDTTIVNNVRLDALVVAGEIPPSAVPPAPAGMSLTVFDAEVSDGDFEPWIEKWILENHPTRIGEDWLGNFEPNTDIFSVEFPDNTFFSWLNNGSTGPIFSSSNRYIRAKYIEYLDSSEAAVVQGTENTGATSLPDVTGWDVESSSGTFTPVSLNRVRTTIWSFDNGDPDIIYEDAVDADVSDQLNTSVDVHSRDVVIQQNGIELQGEHQIWNFIGTDTTTNDYTNTIVTTTVIGGGVIRTETATTTGEQVTPSWTTRYDTQDIFYGSQYGPEQIFIYELGTGNATLDALVIEADSSGFQEFYPFMPVRVDNESITENQFSSDYTKLKRAYRRAYQGKNFDNLIEKVEDNPSIDDIDYAYLVFGVSLNVQEMACRKYIFNFMEKMIPFQDAGSGNAMSDLEIAIDAYAIALQELRDWENTDWSSTDWGSIPERPILPNVTPPATNTIQLTDNTFGFDYRVSWVHIEINQYVGKFDMDPANPGQQNPKEDDLLLVPGPSLTWQTRENYNTRAGEAESMLSHTIPSMYIYWQVDSNSYRRIQVWGLTSENMIYAGKSVKITSTEALEDDEESGFFIPLHYPTMSEMNIVDYTQMATANAHILFNSYEITKQIWYERGIFKILLLSLIIIVAVMIFPGSFSAGSGIMGGNIAVGTALGLTGTAALVAGVVANYIASIIISELLKTVGNALFGDKWGALFAAIVGFAFGAAMSGMRLFSAESLLGLGNALVNGYAGWTQGDITEMSQDLEEEANEYEKRMKYIQDLIDGLDENNLNFNPIFLTDYRRSGNRRGGSRGYMPETAEDYIQRTTMTGSDVVDITHSMVYDYVNIAKTLPRN